MAVPTADEGAVPLVVSATRAAWLATHGSHPNLVRILGVHHVATGPRLMIEHVAGRDLASLIDAVYPERVPVAEALAIARDIARGLHFLHELRNEKGIAVRLIHGTLAPDVVQIGYDGVARVAGLERLAATRGAPRPGPDTAAPEQKIEGAAVDRRADVFAVAAILLRMATGLKLRDGAMPVPTSQSVPYVPQTVEDVLRRALSPDPAKRHGSAEDFRAALESCTVREGLHVGVDRVAMMLSRHLPEAAPHANLPGPPPRPDQSLWQPAAVPAGAPKWMGVDPVLDQPQRSAGGFDVVSIAVQRHTLPPGTQSPFVQPNPAIPTAAPVAPTMTLAALQESGAVQHAPVPARPVRPVPAMPSEPTVAAAPPRPAYLASGVPVRPMPAMPSEPTVAAVPPPSPPAASLPPPSSPSMFDDEPILGAVASAPISNASADPFVKSSLFSIPKSIAAMTPRSSPNPFASPNLSAFPNPSLGQKAGPAPSSAPGPFARPSPNPSANPSPNPNPYPFPNPSPPPAGAYPFPHPPAPGSQPSPGPAPLPLADLPLHLAMPAAASMIAPAPLPGHAPHHGYPAVTDAVRLPDAPRRRRLLTDPVFLLGIALVLFFAALVIAYLASA